MSSESASAALVRRAATLSRLVEISLILNSTLALDTLLQRIIEAAAELAVSEAASLLLKNPNTNDLYFAASSRGGAAALIGKPVPLEGSLAGAILQEDRPIAIDDVSRDPRHYHKMDEQTHFHTRSLLGVPMRIKDRVVGVLEAVNKIDGPWTAEDQETLCVLAAQAAVAIENARLVADLQAANKELSQVDKLKSDFIAIASHELRTPLGVILGYASFLKEDAQGEASEHADAVLRSALRLRTLIEDMVNLRYLKLGKSELTLENMTVARALDLARHDVEDLARAKGQQLVVHLPDPSPVVRADPALLDMALGNLLNNAVKFTPSGGRIIVDVVRRPSEVWITVRDTGVGIPADQLEAIFQEFYQVEDPLVRRQGGMGLGLSIARAVAEAHGGRLWAESPGPDQGSTFYLCLPLAAGT
jgi:signal transduction histidine kinase